MENWWSRQNNCISERDFMFQVIDIPKSRRNYQMLWNWSKVLDALNLDKTTANWRMRNRPETTDITPSDVTPEWRRKIEESKHRWALRFGNEPVDEVGFDEHRARGEAVAATSDSDPREWKIRGNGLGFWNRGKPNLREWKIAEAKT